MNCILQSVDYSCSELIDCFLQNTNISLDIISVIVNSYAFPCLQQVWKGSQGFYNYKNENFIPCIVVDVDDYNCVSVLCKNGYMSPKFDLSKSWKIKFASDLPGDTITNLKLTVEQKVCSCCYKSRVLFLFKNEQGGQCELCFHAIADLKSTINSINQLWIKQCNFDQHQLFRWMKCDAAGFFEAVRRLTPLDKNSLLNQSRLNQNGLQETILSEEIYLNSEQKDNIKHKELEQRKKFIVLQQSMRKIFLHAVSFVEGQIRPNPLDSRSKLID